MATCAIVTPLSAATRRGLRSLPLQPASARGEALLRALFSPALTARYGPLHCHVHCVAAKHARPPYRLALVLRVLSRMLRKNMHGV